MRVAKRPFATLLGAAGLVAAMAGTPAAAAPLSLTPEQSAIVADHVRQEKRASAPSPSGFVPSLGSVLPSGIPLYWLPPAAGLNRFRYTVVDGRTLIVEPDGRSIVVTPN
jgi:hypothetical protein